MTARRYVPGTEDAETLRLLAAIHELWCFVGLSNQWLPPGTEVSRMCAALVEKTMADAMRGRDAIVAIRAARKAAP